MLNKEKLIDDIHHRSKKRIKVLGEVFTPEPYILDMLNLLDKKIWGDENVCFFEPCCGHGNMIIAIFKRRLVALDKKYQRSKKSRASLAAVANAMNTLWAIDIDKSNVDESRERVFSTAVQFISNALEIETNQLLVKHRFFIVHLACAIVWQIQENETLSCLSNSENATQNAKKTKIGYSWFKKNGHKQLQIKLSWTDYYKECEKENSIPIIYERAIKALDNMTKNKTHKIKEFEFMHSVLNLNTAITENKLSVGITKWI